jgi:hypothetical protein
MKKQTIAQPTKEWEGFRFVPYWLDEKKILDMLVIEQRRVNGKVEQIPSTVGSIYKSLAEHETDSEKLSLWGPSFNCQILGAMLNLRKKGVDPFRTQWFWYDINRCIEEPHEIYIFFVVYDDKIVWERVEFSDYTQSGFDPSIFDARDDREPIYSIQAAMEKAEIRFWYRKFYLETRTGQIMVLRHDHPRLYDYETQRRGPDSSSLLEHAVGLLTKIHTLLWVLIVLACLMLIRSFR